jgi:hypothetical protein
MRWISTRSDQRLILWTSSYKKEINDIVNWLRTHKIYVDYINENPEEEHTPTANFAKKFYFNILIDDKAGFNVKKDWKLIKNTLIKINEWH